MKDYKHIQPYLCDIIGVLWFNIAMWWKYFEDETLCNLMSIVGLFWLLGGCVMRIYTAVKP